MRGPALEAGGDPVRVRVLGENWVAFRAEDGRVAILDEACPHRGASLVLGRNEKCAIRCIYHGWNISVEGKVTETPNDPSFPHPERIRVRKAHVREAGQIIWAWFGTGEPPPFPDYVFNTLPADTHVRTIYAKVKCNWLPLAENGLDPLHGAILHGPGNKEAWERFENFPSTNHGSPIYASDNTPPLADLPPTRMAFEATDYGFRHKVYYAYAGTNANVSSPVAMPFVQFVGADGVGSGPDPDKAVFLFTPVDDENTLFWLLIYNPTKPIGAIGSALIDYTPNPDNYVPEDFTAENNWHQDRAAMRTMRSFTGLAVGKSPYSVYLEDVAVCESMGAVPDLTKETLCAADLVIAQARTVYVKAIRQHMAGEGAWGLHADVSRITMPDGPDKAPWKEEADAPVQPETVDA